MTRWAKVWGLAFVLCSASSVGAGCTVKQDDAARFREPVPAHADVALSVPGAQGTATGAGAASTQGLHLATVGVGASSSAQYYQFTRDITDAVDVTTGGILVLIEAIVASPPTSIDATHAVWGPGASALDPVVWRFTVTETSPDVYDYVLEGQPKAGGAFSAVLTGHGFGDASPQHRTGWFQADNDAAKALDPSRNHDSGTTKVTFDLTKIPASIVVALRPTVDASHLDIAVTHDAAGAGAVDISGLTDISNPKDGQLEDVHLLSRWSPAGAGRADLRFSGGDLGAVTLDASECWSSTFARVYYKDSVNSQPAAGDESACVFTGASL